MARRLFGARKGQVEPTINWPQLSDAILPAPEPKMVNTLVSALTSDAEPDPPKTAASPEEELLDRVGAFRAAVADALYEISNDYRVLCNLTHADLTSCDELINELRGRLSGNIHYAVLARLDEMHALVASHVGREA